LVYWEEPQTIDQSQKGGENNSDKDEDEKWRNNATLTVNEGGQFGCHNHRKIGWFNNLIGWLYWWIMTCLSTHDEANKEWMDKWLRWHMDEWKG
jgi:hypothetical protein